MSAAAKRAFERGTRHPTGGTCQWMSYKDIRVQGTYEFRTCKILDAWMNLNLISSWEYTNDRISYVWPDGTEHTYLIDFKIIDVDQTIRYIETKGFIREHDPRKWDAARALGLNLEIWFLDDIERHEFDISTRSSTVERLVETQEVVGSLPTAWAR